VTSLVAEPTASGATVALDIWHRPFGAVGLADVMPTVPPAMLAGIIPHAVERAMMEREPASADGSVVPVLSVGAVFEAAAAQGIPTRLLAGSLPADAPYDPESRVLLQRALDAGRLVIVPERSVDLGGRPRIGWWLVDPDTSATVDQMDDGMATSIVQWGVYVSVFMLAGYAIHRFGREILCNMARAAGASSETPFIGGSLDWACGKASEAGESQAGSASKPMPLLEAPPGFRGPPQLEKAHKAWKERSKDRALH
jgi:hypothetical protein